MTANHAPGCPAIADVRDGCSCLLRGVAAQGGALHDDPCDCWACRTAVAAQDHRPECPTGNPYTDLTLCICDRLFACEARVTERHNAEHEDDRLAAFQNGYDAATVKERQRSVLLIADAYGKALDAARDAVAAECIAHHGYTPGQTCPYCTDALWTIAALKGMSE